MWRGNKVGDLYSALGQGEQAREAYLKSLAIFERLARRSRIEPITSAT